MLELVLIGYLAYTNSVRAKLKLQNPTIWAIATVGAFIVGELIGYLFTVLFFYKGPVESKALVSFYLQNPLHSTFALVCGFGGYLIIRYILDKMPTQKNDNV